MPPNEFCPTNNDCLTIAILNVGYHWLTLISSLMICTVALVAENVLLYVPTPLTCNLELNVVVPIPTLVPLSKIKLLPIALALVNLGT